MFAFKMCIDHFYKENKEYKELFKKHCSKCNFLTFKDMKNLK